MMELVELVDLVNWRLILPLIIVSLLLTAIALVSCIRTEETNGPKWVWVLLILLVNPFGPILYFVMGRKQN